MDRLVEKLDLAGVHGRPFDLEAVWETGHLDGDFDAVRARIGENRAAS